MVSLAFQLLHVLQDVPAGIGPLICLPFSSAPILWLPCAPTSLGVSLWRMGATLPKKFWHLSHPRGERLTDKYKRSAHATQGGTDFTGRLMV